MDREKDILTTEEAANYLQVQPITIREWAREGNIPAKKIGRQWRFSKRVLLEWIESEDD